MVLLLNIWISLRGNQTSYWFACTLPAIEEYLKNQEEGDVESTNAENMDVETINNKQ